MRRAASAPRLKPDAPSVQLHQLEQMSLVELRTRWQTLFGSAPAATWQRAFLASAIAWRLQILDQGDVAAQTRRDLIIAAAQARRRRGASEADASPALPPASASLRPGTRLVKVHNGLTHIIEVVEAGLVYEGQIWNSLSAIARHITGTHWNGLLFFGLRKRGPKRPKVSSA